jgi:hypothetical protein
MTTMNNALAEYVEKFVGSIEGFSIENMPRVSPLVSDIPEGLVFKHGATKYARIGSEILNLKNGNTVNPSSVLSSRSGKFAVACAVISALSNN